MNGTRTVMLTHLKALATALRPTELDGRLRQSSNPPYLLVTNAELVGVQGPVLNERISAHRQEGGAWLFHWSWGDVLGPVDDLAGVVATLRRVLTVADPVGLVAETASRAETRGLRT